MNKEEKKKLLFPQIEGILDANMAGRFEQVEYIYDGIRNYILKENKDFIDGTVSDEKKYKQDTQRLLETYVKQIETALDGKNSEDKINTITSLLTALNNDYANISQKYIGECIHSVVSYYDRL